MWKWILRRKKVFIVRFVSISVCIYVLKLIYCTFDFSCSFDEIKKAVGMICKEYQNRKALGDMCFALCESKSLYPVSCLTHHVGKEVVFEAKYNEKSVVVKSSKLNSSMLDQVFWVNDYGYPEYPSREIFYDIIRNSLERNLNTKLPDKKYDEDIISKLWNGGLLSSTYIPLSVQTNTMDNIWHLIQQAEYLLLKFYENKNIFPKILGTCGHFYIVEYIRPLDNLFLILYPAWRNEFTERAKLGIQILDYLDKIASLFPDLHICDVKMGHFGLDALSNVKFLDMDMVFFEPSLIQNMVAVQNCSNDQDCSFVDCKGSCNEETQVCEPIILNDNFQRVCSSIFSGRVSQKYFGLLGLPPSTLADELYSLLQKCSANKNNSSTTQNIANQLKILLKTVVNQV